MDGTAPTELVIDLMSDYLRRSGVGSDQPQRRYLWTDAHAVCNLIGLARSTGEVRYQEMALALVDAVHQQLGRHRSDDPRQGWLSGPHGTASDQHPTRAGLRIGKPLPERGADAPFDEAQEWERDGQYFHYLTRWMHALDVVGRALALPHYRQWARELAVSAHRAFTRTSATGDKRMVWKMSIDLSRPQVASMGHHDPLDGYVTALQLQRAPADGPDLQPALTDYAAMIRGGQWSTSDSLGLGGLLVDACRVEQITRQGVSAQAGLLEGLLAAASAGLQATDLAARSSTPATHRLAFRELGLAIGLAGVARLEAALAQDPKSFSAEAKRLLDQLHHHAGLRDQINAFWLETGNRQVATWTEHRDINEVMLATSLHPQGYLELPA